VLPIAGVVVAGLAVLLPLLWTPYSGDDVINATLPEVMAAEHASRWSVIRELTSQWIEHEGRFFPGAVSYGALVFTTFTTRVAYKLFLAVLWAVTLAAVANWTRRFSGDRTFGVVVAICTIGTLSFRYPSFHDGVSAYSGLLPWTLLLFTLVLALAARRPEARSAAALAVAALLWSVALVTYEVVVVLVPVVVACVLTGSSDRRWHKAVLVALGIPLVACLTTVAVLRTRLDTAAAPGYTIRLDPGDVVVTFGKQLVASLPLAQFWLPRTAASWPALDVVAVIVAIVAGCAGLFVMTRHDPRAAPEHRLGWLAVMGAWLWAAPAFLVGITARWQRELPWGQGYLSVVISSVGVALVLAVAHRATARWAARSGSRAVFGRLCHVLVTVVTACAVMVTAAVNVAFVRGG
jgi:hypothetical protein